MKKIFGLLASLSLSIAPMMSVVACDNSDPDIDPNEVYKTISTRELDSLIYYYGQIIYIKPVYNPLGQFDSDGTMQEFITWFNHFTDSMLLDGNVEYGTDYSIYAENNFQESKVTAPNIPPPPHPDDPDWEPPDDPSFVYVQQIIISPVYGSQYIIGGSDIVLNIVIADQIYIGNYIPDTSQDYLFDSPINVFGSTLSSPKPVLNISKINGDDDLREIFSQNMTWNLVGFDSDIIDWFDDPDVTYFDYRAQDNTTGEWIEKEDFDWSQKRPYDKFELTVSKNPNATYGTPDIWGDVDEYHDLMTVTFSMVVFDD